MSYDCCELALLPFITWAEVWAPPDCRWAFLPGCWVRDTGKRSSFLNSVGLIELNALSLMEALLEAQGLSFFGDFPEMNAWFLISFVDVGERLLLSSACFSWCRLF